MQVEHKQILGVPCPNCGVQIKICRPAVAGRYNIHCKACGTDCFVDIPEEFTEKSTEKAVQDAAPPKKKPTLGVICPHCHTKISMDIPSQAGLYKLHCKVCNRDFMSKITEQIIQKSNTVETKATDAQQAKESAEEKRTGPTRQLTVKGSGVAVLVRKRLFFADKEYRLRDGANTIGAKDDHLASDIMIDDNAISRRSVTLTSELTGNGTYRYLFTLNRATNPVRLNGKIMEVGTSLYIEPGTVIQLGRTKLTLKLIH